LHQGNDSSAVIKPSRAAFVRITTTTKKKKKKRRRRRRMTVDLGDHAQHSL